MVDDFLNTISMYRLVLYVLICLIVISLLLTFFHSLPFNPLELLLSVSILLISCWLINQLLAKLFKVPTNVESPFITALILSLIITPASTISGILFLLLAALLSQAAKYLLIINRQHLFNPAAIAVVLTGIIIHQFASWWVGNIYLLAPVIVGGLLILRKVRRFSLFLTFLLIYLIFILVSSRSFSVLKTLLELPIFFFGLIMLTEPQTTPPSRKLQMIYGGLVGVLTFYQTPEVALLIGNIFSFLISPKQKLLLTLTEKKQIAPDTYDFEFKSDQKLKFSVGQYLEWTLSHHNVDSRGNRRFFSLASSPTEEFLRIGTKFYPKGSSFKRALGGLEKGERIIAGQLSGEFTLPKDQNKKLVFIAGGIGITPFRSMVKFLLDTKQKRDIVLLYSVKEESEIVYQDIFDQAKLWGIKTVYVITEKMGYINEDMIKKEVNDYKDRVFYISGPHSMVDAFEKTLKTMGIKQSQIKIDFFPGYV